MITVVMWDGVEAVLEPAAMPRDSRGEKDWRSAMWCRKRQSNQDPGVPSQSQSDCQGKAGFLQSLVQLIALRCPKMREIGGLPLVDENPVNPRC